MQSDQFLYSSQPKLRSFCNKFLCQKQPIDLCRNIKRELTALTHDWIVHAAPEMCAYAYWES